MRSFETGEQPDLDWGEYRKVATARAVEMDEPFEVHTLEGTMTGQVGDFLMLGAAGELYPCARAIFENTYVPADPPAEDEALIEPEMPSG